MGPFRTHQNEPVVEYFCQAHRNGAAAGCTGIKLLDIIRGLASQAPSQETSQEDGMTNLVAAPVSETFSIVGTCINCTAPASLLATMTVIAIGVALALSSECRRAGKA